MENKIETISWLKNVEIDKNDALDMICYFLQKPHLKEIDFFKWDLSDFENLIATETSIDMMLSFIRKNQEKKSIRRSHYQSYKKSIQEGIYIPKYDYIFSSVIKDVNFLSQLFCLNSKHKEHLFKNISMERAIDFLLFLKIIYNEKMVVHLLNKVNKPNDVSLWHDIICMLSHQESMQIIEKYFQKVKLTPKSLHDEIVRVNHTHKFQKKENQVFIYSREQIFWQSVENGFTFRLPGNDKELHLWSELLHTCLFSYSHKVLSKQSTIYGVFQEENLLYALELVNNKIVQARGCYNKNIPHRDKKVIDLWIDNNCQNRIGR